MTINKGNNKITELRTRTLYILDDTNRSAGEKSLKPALAASTIMGIKSIFILELMKR
jgi:hypothetical protein